MCVDHGTTNGLDYCILEKIEKQVQELLQQVRQERETTHEWVSAVRASVENWVEEQRKLIACERKHAVERAAQLLIQEQATKIKLLEAKLHQPNAGVHTSQTPQVDIKTQRQLHDDSFFAEMDQHESPTLPHLPKSKPVRCKREYTSLSNGRKLVKFRNGSEREYSPDGSLTTRYINGDFKAHSSDGTVVYWHAKEETKQTVHPTGDQVFEYPNQQIERHYPDGRKEITFPNGVTRVVHGRGRGEL